MCQLNGELTRIGPKSRLESLLSLSLSSIFACQLPVSKDVSDFDRLDAGRDLYPFNDVSSMVNEEEGFEILWVMLRRPSRLQRRPNRTLPP